MAKKKGPKKGPGKKKGKGVTIDLVTGVGANPSQATAKRNDPSGPADRVRWWNRTAVADWVEISQLPQSIGSGTCQ